MNNEHAARNDPHDVPDAPAESSPASSSGSYVFTSSRYSQRASATRAGLSQTLRTRHADGALDVKSTIIPGSPDANGFVPLSTSPTNDRITQKSEAPSPTADYFSTPPPRLAPSTLPPSQQWLSASTSIPSFSPSLPSLTSESASTSPSIGTPPSGFSPQSFSSHTPGRRNQTDLSLTQLFTFSGRFGKTRADTSYHGYELEERGRKRERKKPAKSAKGFPEAKQTSKLLVTEEDEEINILKKRATMTVSVILCF